MAKAFRRDYKQAAYWYTKASEQGDAEAQYFLGYMYEDGKGVPQDYKQAIYWYNQSIRTGRCRSSA